MIEYNNNNPNAQKIPYMGGTPVRCPRCSNVVTNRFCDFCGLDLSTVYFKTQTQQPVQPPQYPYGQQYPPHMYQYSARPQKKSILLIIGVTLLLLVMCAVPISIISKLFLSNVQQQQHTDGIKPPIGQEEYYFAGGVSSDEFKKLKNDMSYAQVSSIIGGDGEIVNSGKTLQGETYYTYGWYGENNPNAAVYITITSDKVSDITLEGQL